MSTQPTVLELVESYTNDTLVARDADPAAAAAAWSEIAIRAQENLERIRRDQAVDLMLADVAAVIGESSARLEAFGRVVGYLSEDPDSLEALVAFFESVGVA